jgi:ubiquinone biosynthesis protein UbiJ
MLDFLRLSADSSSAGLLANNIVIIGDTTVAEQFKELFAHLEIDWEEQLSHVAGDVIARQMGNFFRALSRWAKQSARTARQDLTEYLQEEIRLVPPREELQDFFSEIDHLRNDVERIEVRINRLKQQLTE